MFLGHEFLHEPQVLYLKGFGSSQENHACSRSLIGSNLWCLFPRQRMTLCIASQQALYPCDTSRQWAVPCSLGATNAKTVILSAAKDLGTDRTIVVELVLRQRWWATEEVFARRYFMPIS